MARVQKIVLALAVTVVLHVALVIYALAPRWAGLAEPPAATPAAAAPGTPVVDEVAAMSSAPDAPTAAPVADSQLPLDVGWAEPAKPLEKPPAAEAEKPTAPPPAEKPAEKAAEKVVEKPAEKPVEKAAEKPAPASKPEAKPAPKAEPKPVEKKLSKAEQKAAEKVAAKLAADEAALAALAATKVAALAGKTTPKPAAAAPPAAAVTKPAAGGSTNVIAADSGYANRVRQHLARFAGALPPGANGEARVQFVVLTNGRVSEVHLVKFSGNTALDAVALNLPSQAQPLPLPGPVAQRLEVPVQAIATPP